MQRRDADKLTEWLVTNVTKAEHGARRSSAIRLAVRPY
jgi:hypothetical protein